MDNDNVNEGVQPEQAQAEQQAQVQQPETGQKTMSQEEINGIIQREKARAAEKARREAQAEFDRQQAQQQQQQPQQAQQQPQVDEDRLYSRFQERMEKERQQQEMERVASAYRSRLDAVKDKYEDFDEVLGQFNHGAYPFTVYLATQADNTGDLMYELAKSPYKALQINQLAREGDVQSAQRELKKVAESVKLNEQAKQEAPKTQAPLSRMKPTTVGSDDGKMNLRDLKKASWLRG